MRAYKTMIREAIAETFPAYKAGCITKSNIRTFCIRKVSAEKRSYKWLFIFDSYSKFINAFDREFERAENN